MVAPKRAIQAYINKKQKKLSIKDTVKLWDLLLTLSIIYTVDNKFMASKKK